ncbi:MAG: aminodeoxychorismate/anthranilate synthase component II [Fimbriimonadia bacterium]|jgi:anthranilate synthase/aminodeoxychorismate synthase-like glutamine amidotransferase
MLLMIDNYDSFTYNLVQYLGEMGIEPFVCRNDELSVDEVEKMGPSAIVLSPGPCTPVEAGVCVPLIQRLAGRVPIFGVCLGHQAIGAAFGGNIVRARRLMHGKASSIRHDGSGVFEGLPCPFSAIRYHSLVIERETMPECLVETATSEDDGEIMGVRHREFALEGIQFHPESILTEHGKTILRNFCRQAGLEART